MRARLAALVLVCLVVGVTRADIGFTPAGGGVSAASPTFTGTVTLDRLRASGTAPASCAATGNGAGSCAIVAGSTDSAGIITITTAAAGTAATGTATLTFSAVQGAVLPICMAILQGDGVNWSATASIRSTQSSGTASCVWAWDNTSALTVSETYQIAYIVISK